MRGWYNPHFTHRELKHEVIKVKSFHYFFVLPRTWFLSLFNTLLSVSQAQYALPQLLLWELSTPSRQTRNLHPHVRNTRSTQSVITSDKVGFKNLPSTTQKFCGKEEDKHSFPGQHVTAFTTCCACSRCNPSSTCSFRARQQAKWSSWTYGGCPCLSASYHWLPQEYVLCEGNRHSSVSHLVTSVLFSLRESNRKRGTKVLGTFYPWCRNGKTQWVGTPNHAQAQTAQWGTQCLSPLPHIFPFLFLTPPHSGCTCFFLSL